MIVFKIQAGLGNQLFQWAYSFSLSKQHEVHYDISFYRYQHANRNVSIRELDINKLLKNQMNFLHGNSYNQFNSKEISHIKDDFTYRKHAIRDDEHYYFDGYWQSENYFKIHRKEILNSLNLPTPQGLDFQGSCSIHVRRGDYLNNPDLHPVQTPIYYKKALDIIQPRGKVYILSDDIEWCKNNLNIENSQYIEHNTNIMDLSVISKCEHNICANSSFSWWGAWLNENPLKKIVCPYQWVGPSGPKDFNIAPDSWIRI